MRSCWKKLGMVAAALLSMGGFLCSARAQFPPPSGDHGPPPGMPAEFPGPAHAAEEPNWLFSYKDGGLPNAFQCIEPGKEPYCWQLAVDYLQIWYRPATLPPVATTGSIADVIPGALGQPNTAVLTGGPMRPGGSTGVRTTFTYWLTQPELIGLEANFFIMEQRSIIRSYKSDENGNPVLARPFIDVDGFENADPRAIPSLLSGSLSDSMRTRLMGSELNVRCCIPYCYEGCGINLIGGLRWLRLDERYSNFDTANFIAAGDSSTFSDTFTTYNQFFGGQVGAELMYQMGRFRVGLLSKIAVGPNLQRVQVSGQTVNTDAAGLVTMAPQGLYAQPTNVGINNAVQVAILPETAIKFTFDVSAYIRFNVGYTLFFLTNTVRPGDQIDRRVNIQTLNAPVIPPLVPVPPSFQESIFHAHMLNVGLEFAF